MKPSIRRAGGALALVAAAAGAAPATLDSASAQHDQAHGQPLVITADRLFTGRRMQSGLSVLVRDGRIVQIAPRARIDARGVREIHIPGGTLLPGFIDMHTHHLVNGVPARRALEHGVTTARDLGGPIAPVSAAPFRLRQILSGPIITARRGYPLPVFARQSGVAVAGPRQARATVRRLAARGAGVIAVSLEPGGSQGAPWSHHEPAWSPPWPVLDKRELRAVVSEAHRLRRKVVAYLSGARGVRAALDARVDEWAHMPCERLPAKLIRRAGRQRVAIDGTLDTLSHCSGSTDNAVDLVDRGARLFYGTDMGHVNIPNGIDAEEIHQMINAGLTPERALAAATGAAGRYLGLSPLGRLIVGAPADIIAVAGDPRKNLKGLEYPNLVVADGAVVIQRAAQGGGSPHH